jgi:biopolymer transport protein ExbD
MRARVFRQSHGHEGINVTPLIDVVMCLIVFFLIVGKLAADRAAHVKLPQTQYGERVKSAAPLVIDVVRAPGEGSAWLHQEADLLVLGREITGPDDFRTLLESRLEETPELSIEIRADKLLPYGVVEPVLRACTQVGAHEVRLATERRR